MGTPTVINYWYDRSWKSWGVAPYNAEGNQLGEATWVYTRREALQVARSLADDGRLPIVKLPIAN